MENVLPSRKRGSEEEDLRREPEDGLAVAPSNVKVAALFRRNRFDGTVVDMGLERSFVVDNATGLDMDDEEQMEEVKRRVRDEDLQHVHRADAGHGDIH